VNATLVNGRVVIDPDTLPISLFVYLDEVPAVLPAAEVREHLTCTLNYEDQRYVGTCSVDDVPNGATRAAGFITWTELLPDVRTRAAAQLNLLVPRDPAVLRRITLAIDYDSA
jgi:hypothetical protein